MSDLTGYRVPALDLSCAIQCLEFEHSSVKFKCEMCMYEHMTMLYSEAWLGLASMPDIYIVGL